MIDPDKTRKKIAQIEAHVEWVRQHIGDGPTLEHRLSEISKFRANIAAASPTKCPLVRHSE